MKLTLTKEFNEFIIRQDGELLTTLIGYTEPQAIARFDKVVEANKHPERILIKEVEI